MSKLSTSPHLKYRFWIQTKDGAVIEWPSLTEQQAKRLQSLTDRTIGWANVNSFGWGVMK